MLRYTFLATGLIFLATPGFGDETSAKPDQAATEQVKTEQPTLKPGSLPDTRNVHVFGNIMTAGQPSEAALAVLADQGFKTIVTLRAASEESFDEAASCEKVGMKFVRLPIGSPEHMTDELFRNVSKLLRAAEPEGKVLLHCAAANRAGAVWLTHRVNADQLSLDDARKEAVEVGLRSKPLEDKAVRGAIPHSR